MVVSHLDSQFFFGLNCFGIVDLLTLQVVNQIGASNPLASLAALGLPALNAQNSGAINPAGRFLVCFWGV